MQVLRSTITAVAFVIALGINPMYVAGCASEDDPNFEFGEPEMLALLDEVSVPESWELSYGGEDYVVELMLEQAGEMARATPAGSLFATKAHACGSKMRMFGSTASACATRFQSVMQVEGTLTLSRVEGDQRVEIASVPVQGTLEVEGPRISEATLLLGFGEHNHVELVRVNAPFRLTELAAVGLGQEAIDISYEDR